MGINTVLSTEHKMFGVPKGGTYHFMEKQINHMIIVAKMCISKFVYGDYGNLLKLFEHELKLRNICNN